MYGLTRQRRSRMGAPTPPTAQLHTIPASVGGINALSPHIGMAPEDCYYTYNLMPIERGLELRKGYREWATGVGTTETDVRTIIPFQGAAEDGSNDKLFAVTADGIYDVTTDGETSPTRDVTFSTTSGDAGYGVWAEMTLDTGAQVLFYADPQNGLRQYTESTGNWTVPSLTGVTVADVAFVMVHKQRVWVVEKNSADAYYGGVASISGSFTKFTFGAKFTYGGNLMGLWSWTVDGGNGVDDFLAAISRAGDVLVYKGEDPALTDPETTSLPWQLVGSWFIGEVPKSRRIVADYGGEMYALSSFGLVAVRNLLQGVAADDNRSSPSAKINKILREAVIADIDSNGWDVKVFPGDGFLQVIRPYSQASEAIQYNQNLLTKAWGYWADVPMICAETWSGNYYMGGASGKVWIYDGALDNTLIDGTAGDSIDFRLLTSFQPYGNHALYKYPGVVRIVGVTSGLNTYNLKTVFDYDINEEASAPTAAAPSGEFLWDDAVWDTAVWDYSIAGESTTLGGANIGRAMAIAVRGTANNRVTIVGWDVLYSEGGPL